MSDSYNRSELVIVVILRLMGGSALFAIPAIFMPYDWMNEIHQFLGLGELPAAPIVDYLARSLSAFYAVLGVITLFVSLDIRRNRSFVRLTAVIVCVFGVVLLGIDVAAGMPSSWTLTEGPPTLIVGLILWACQRNIRDEDGSS